MPAQHKEELDTFNKAVRTLMKLNGNTAVDFSALDAEFSALQSGSAELRTKLETLQPDISALKNIRKYIDMVLNKQQLSAPNSKTSKRIGAETAGAASAEKVPLQSDFYYPKPRRIALNDLSVTDTPLQSVAEIHNSFVFLLAFACSRRLVSRGVLFKAEIFSSTPHFRPLFSVNSRSASLKAGHL